MAKLRPFSDEQTRVLVNLRQRYEVWRDAERALRALPYDLRRKRLGPLRRVMPGDTAKSFIRRG